MGIRKFNLRRSRVTKKKEKSFALLVLPPPTPPPKITSMLLGLKYDFVDILFVLGHEAHPKTAKRSHRQKCHGSSAQNLMKSPSNKKIPCLLNFWKPLAEIIHVREK